MPLVGNAYREALDVLGDLFTIDRNNGESLETFIERKLNQFT